MSDTPKRFNWSSAGMLPATNGAFVHERDLAAATKERDEATKQLQILRDVVHKCEPRNDAAGQGACSRVIDMARERDALVSTILTTQPRKEA